MKKMMLITCLLLSTAVPAFAEEVVVKMQLATEQGPGQELGTITAAATQYGTVFTPNLAGLTPGLHGFHIHQNPSCAPAEKEGKMVAALAAGGHFDPAGTNKHAEPWADGHLGDLPALYVDETGKATTPVLAPRVKLADVKGRSFMLHAGGDNYADQPKPLGGGGARMACGVAQ